MSANQPRTFVDTNIVVYAFDRSAGERHEAARRLLGELATTRRGCLSVQVLQEFFVTVTRKGRPPLPEQEARAILADLAVWPVHAPASHDVLAAVDTALRHRIAFWDAMIVQSATALSCARLATEDLQSGQLYGGVRAWNPFTAAV